MFERLQEIEKRYNQLQELLARPETLQDKKLYPRYARELAGLSLTVDRYKQYKVLLKEIENIETMLANKEHHGEKEFLKLAKEELDQLNEKKKDLELQLEEMLLEEEDSIHKNIILEIRAGTGGEEAALFCADLYRMYTKYAAKCGWKMELLSSRPTAIGGVKEVIFSLQGEGVFKKLKYESGVHRVQRVPQTETSGRIHTSAVSVAVLPEPQEVELKLDPKDIKIDVYRSTGPGGQGVNTTDSAVRITHFPTGIVVSCQDERSQMKNKAKAMRVLRARLLNKMQTDQKKEISQARKSQVGTGDRSEKIRTYNFPDSRVTDHRIGFTLHKLELVLEGNLEEIVQALISEDRKRRLKEWKKE
ncbi:MAG: peptide chain release factor 1 [Candidatus Omnitrophota bacterium]|nr:MAG: peptide chain release factor 1 [Candidatus Omnitrophota bacterium]